MTVNQTTNNIVQTDPLPPIVATVPVDSPQGWRRHWSIAITIILLALFAFSVPTSTIAPTELRQWGMGTIVHQWQFNLVAWEVDALWGKFRAYMMQPAHGIDYPTSVQIVREYLARAQRIRAIEQAMNDILVAEDALPVDMKSASEAPNAAETAEKIANLQQKLDSLRRVQQQQRPAVEQIIESQIAYELAADKFTVAGQVLPPVQFMFVEPPRKLVVSPRDRITIEYSEMLDAEMSLAEINAAETAYQQEFNSSAYITNIGGLGAFPTMVIDQASLNWILSTVAHEWTHNYLTLYPLGFNYMTSNELTTMNETVAEIVGNELGARALQTFYPELVPPPMVPAQDRQAANDNVAQADATIAEPIFDFRIEMRATRLRVDELLAAGKITEAEQYMAKRRLDFVANGYPLRVLNQAYFAFHGSYGTSAASTSPIGPKMAALRATAPDLKTFLVTVRTFTSVNDLDETLGTMEE